jgi:plastocyanin
MRVSALGKVLAGSLAAALIAGCGGGARGPSPMPASNSRHGTPMSLVVEPTHITFDSGSKVGVRLNGETAFTSPRYGKVLGYFKGVTSTTSAVVMLEENTNVVFDNVDRFSTHTASFLGDATRRSAPWPSTFNGSSTKSPAGTAIGTTQFSTGALSPGQSSLVYNTGAPGFYMIGCAFHYNSFGMRTVIVVKL